METLVAWAMTIAMLAAFLLGAGGVYLVVKRREPRKGALMIAAAAVLIANVAIWTV